MTQASTPSPWRSKPDEAATPERPLAGVRVLDLSQGIAGPYSAMMLGQQGAEVIKVEPPVGDWSRHMGRQKEGLSAIFVASNAGKQGLCIDAATPGGKAQLKALALQADVIVQNYRPGVADRMGVGWAELSALKPELVYVSVSGWGGSGPMAKAPTVDTTMQAASGMMHGNRSADGRPQRIGLFVVDLSTGLYAAQATVSALLYRFRTGRGKHVEVSMLESAAALQSSQIIDAELYPEGEAAANAPGGLFDTRDGQLLFIGMLNDPMFKRLAQAMDMPEWLADTSLHTSAGRIPRALALSQQLGRQVATHDLEHWLDRLVAHDVLCARVKKPVQLPQDEQAQHLQVFTPHVVTDQAEVHLARLPGGAPMALSPAPKLGEHNALLGQAAMPA